MLSTAVVVGLIFANYFFGPVVKNFVSGTEMESKFKLLYGVSGVLLVFSGLFNIHLVKGKTDMKPYPVWKWLVYIKFGFGICLTPLLVSFYNFRAKL